MRPTPVHSPRFRFRIHSATDTIGLGICFRRITQRGEFHVSLDEIQLPLNVVLPEQTRVTVTVASTDAKDDEAITRRTARIASPRLVNPKLAGDFEMEVLEVEPDAKI